MKTMSHPGDEGKTTFLGKGRLWKDDIRIKALGSLDEARSALGLVRAFTTSSLIEHICSKLQSALGLILAEVATEKTNVKNISRISESDLLWIEEKNHEIECELEIDSGFLIPGKSKIGAMLDFARVTMRRAERECSHLSRKSIIFNPTILAWLNRTSTLLFSLEKSVTQKNELEG